MQINLQGEKFGDCGSLGQARRPDILNYLAMTYSTK